MQPNMKMIQQMQNRMMKIQQELEEAVVEGTAGGGVVRIEATAGGEVLAVHIDPAAVDPDDVEGLEDLVLAALRDLHAETARLQSEAMGGFDPSGMLGGLLGGDEVDEPADDADE